MSQLRLSPSVVWVHPLPVGLAGAFEAPSPERFVGDRDAAIEHHFLDVAEAQRESVVQPHAIANDLGGKAMATVGISHEGSFPKSAAHSQISTT